MSDHGWRRGDEAAWWDAERRSWRRGTLVERRTIPTYVYEVAADDGGETVAIPERLLRGVHDPGVVLEAVPASDPVAPRGGPPPQRPGRTLAQRSTPRVNPGNEGTHLS